MQKLEIDIIGTELASFWRRLTAGFLDSILIFLISTLVFVLSAKSRLFAMYLLLPWAIFLVWCRFYLLKRFGGTPGKLATGIRVRKLDDSVIDAKAAFLRSVVELTLSLVLYSTFALMMLQLNDAKFTELSRTVGLGLLTKQSLDQLLPPWYDGLNLLLSVWLWSEYIVLLTNKKHQSFQDLMASTIVVKIHSR